MNNNDEKYVKLTAKIVKILFEKDELMSDDDTITLTKKEVDKIIENTAELCGEHKYLPLYLDTLELIMNKLKVQKK